MTLKNNFFDAPLKERDPAVADILNKELHRQQEHIELIASENIVSRAVMDAMGSVLTNKYAEGYPAHRYYHGCECVDEVEVLAQERAKKIFGAEFVNVQPHSGSQANGAVYLALLQPGDTLMGMSLDAGGHLTHGSRVSSSGKYYHSVSYGIDSNGLIDYDAVAALAKEHQPKIIIAGGSAYPNIIDFQKFRAIADSVGAYLMVDMAHFAGLVAGGVYPNPLPIADVVTTTTHKTLRGPRGGMILTNNPEIAKKINSAVFPGLQGGPLMHVIAGKAVAFGEALQPDFKTYAAQIVKNAKAMATVLKNRGVDLVSGGTESHLMLIDLRSKGLTGAFVCDALASAHIVCNKNAVPNDPQKPSITSGLRVGTPAGTTRGFGEAEFAEIAGLIADIIDACGKDEATLTATIQTVQGKVKSLCQRFPIYEGLSA
ncbi:MAG: serine hydroxymethyltransferase [Alphaproteobacteria bacterium]|nr:serine hydroxymethyltransferase [Alphaproteobacteria bacterium]